MKIPPIEKKYIFVGIGLITLGMLVLIVLIRVATIAAGYKAKVLCSGVFVSNRQPDSILNQELSDDIRIKAIKVDVNRQEKTVTSFLWLIPLRKAVFRPKLGCTLAIDTSVDQLRVQARALLGVSSSQQVNLLPTRTLSSPSSARLEKVLDDAFRENDPEKLKRTLAVVVVQEGHVIAERYRGEITPQTPLAGWSMTKSVINALVGILVQEGKLSLQDQKLIPQWQQINEPRSQITLEQLLQMSSGLKFQENYSNPLSDVVVMLFGRPNSADYAANKPLAFRSGAHWSYASGTTNIISQIVRQTIGGTNVDYWIFPRRKLFDRLGMSNSIMEVDAAGNFVGSSFMYATARDWARFGLLYLQDGVWHGERILPPNWVNYSVTPAPQAPFQMYGAHFWLRIPSESGKSLSLQSLLPSDTFHASGFQGQFVTIITSKKLVIVRLGLSQSEAWNHEFFVRQILEAL